MGNKSIDSHIIWHPLTQEAEDVARPCIVRGEEAYVYAKDGRKFLDLISSWWVNIHGHGNKRIADAIYKQALELEHVIFAGFTHEPAINLCERLKTVLPTNMAKFFFSDNGSTSVEVALKIAYQYWQNQGYKKTKFIAFDGGYHGDTVGAMSVGAKSGFHCVFKGLCFDVHTTPFPNTWYDDEYVEEKEQEAMSVLMSLIAEHSDIAAIILEPIVQGASGMRLMRASFLEKVVKMAQDAGILVIFDEVMTGFGRTGKLFAANHISAMPDIMCLSKGLTGGFLSLALTVVTDKIYEAFLGTSMSKAFLHSHSYTANPIACAAAIASLDMLLQDNVQKRITNIEHIHKECIKELGGICKPRVIGTIGAFDSLKPLPGNFKLRMLQEGLILRPLGNTIYIMPPYCIDNDALIKAYGIISRCLDVL